MMRMRDRKEKSEEDWTLVDEVGSAALYEPAL